MIFDQDEIEPWDKKIFRRPETADSPPVTVWGM